MWSGLWVCWRGGVDVQPRGDDDTTPRVARSRRAMRRATMRIHRERWACRDSLLLEFPDLWERLQVFTQGFLSTGLSETRRARAHRAHASFLRWGDTRFTSSKRARGADGRHRCPCLFCNWDRSLLVALDPFIDRYYVAPGFPSWTGLLREMVHERIKLQREEGIVSTPDRSPQSHSPPQAQACGGV